MSFGMLGGYSAQVLLDRTLDYIGLQLTLYFVDMIGFLFALGVMILMKESPKEIQNDQSFPCYKDGLLEKIQDSQNWIVSLYVGFINVSTWMLGGMWSNEYLVRTHFTNILEARSITGWLFLGMIPSFPCWG